MKIVKNKKKEIEKFYFLFLTFFLLQINLKMSFIEIVNDYIIIYLYKCVIIKIILIIFKKLNIIINILKF